MIQFQPMDHLIPQFDKTGMSLIEIFVLLELRSNIKLDVNRHFWKVDFQVENGCEGIILVSYKLCNIIYANFTIC